MIWDSNPWKHDLWKCAAFLKRVGAQIHPLTEPQRISIERRIFLGFYSIRKLLEAQKLTDRCSQQMTTLSVFPPTWTPITHFNWHRAGEHFDFNAPRSEEWSLIELCHQFIHSYVFHIALGEAGGLTGFFVASDKQLKKKRGLLRINVDSVAAIFQSVATDDIVSFHWTRDPNTNEECFSSK